MLGRTHMGIGAVGAVAASPFILHTSWEPMRQLVTGNWNAIPHVLEAQAALAVAAIIGSVIPDFDQQDSLAARRIEIIGRLVITGIIIALIFMLHMEKSIGAWAVAILMGILAGAERNVTRLVGLGILALGLLYFGVQKEIPIDAAILLVIWIIGAMFTKHRTFTHSLPGLLTFAIGISSLVHSLTKFHLGLAVTGLILGYSLHLAADAIAGGVPLLWPWNKRQGIHLVSTGGGVDHLIGGVAMLGFMALCIV